MVYDPKLISYGQLLKVYFSVAHDPTQLNRQAPDHGTAIPLGDLRRQRRRNRSSPTPISPSSPLRKSFNAPIVTKVEPLKAFYPAEAYHQDYLRLHPDQPYIVYNDAPKLVHLKQLFPHLYKGG